MIKFLQKLRRVYQRLRGKEKRLIAFLLVAAFFLGCLRILIFIRQNTVTAPSSGGSYSEVLIGELKYPNPILARNYPDRTVCNLIYSGLTRINGQGEIEPLLAESWSIPENGKKYIFYLKKNIKWHDNLPLTAKDVEYTIRNIQDPANQSPHQNNWRDVTVKVLDDYTVEFSLAERSAPFLSATTVGIIPAHIPLREENWRMVGTGPYQIDKINLENKKVKNLKLRPTSNWFNQKPWIPTIDLTFTSSQKEAEKLIKEDNKNAIFGEFNRPPIKPEGFKLQSISTSIQLVLFLNSGVDSLSSSETRNKILNHGNLVLNRMLTVLTDKISLKNQSVQSFLNQGKKAGLVFKIEQLNPGQLQEKINKREYDLLIIPIDFGTDQDLYPFFHSSQEQSGGLNFANFEDKNLDKLLEEARVNLDANKRKELQVAIDQNIADQALYKRLDQENLYWLINQKIQGVNKANNVLSQETRLADIENWYIKQKKILKY